jgi:dimeric dUTPase (all-alpha-NTP-PPase superfamily)
MGTSFEDFLEIQKRFNDAVYGDIGDDRKEEITKSLALALHSEVASIASAVNFKDHTSNRAHVNKDKLLYESVDAFRYILALLNTWDITADQFCRAFSDKNSFRLSFILIIY